MHTRTIRYYSRHTLYWNLVHTVYIVPAGTIYIGTTICWEYYKSEYGMSLETKDIATAIWSVFKCLIHFHHLYSMGYVLAIVLPSQFWHAYRNINSALIWNSKKLVLLWPCLFFHINPMATITNATWKCWIAIMSLTHKTPNLHGTWCQSMSSWCQCNKVFGLTIKDLFSWSSPRPNIFVRRYVARRFLVRKGS